MTPRPNRLAALLALVIAGCPQAPAGIDDHPRFPTPDLAWSLWDEPSPECLHAVQTMEVRLVAHDVAVALCNVDHVEPHRLRGCFLPTGETTGMIYVSWRAGDFEEVIAHEMAHALGHCSGRGGTDDDHDAVWFVDFVAGMEVVR